MSINILRELNLLKGQPFPNTSTLFHSLHAEGSEDPEAVARFAFADAIAKEIQAVAGANARFTKSRVIRDAIERTLSSCIDENQLPMGLVSVIRRHPTNPRISRAYDAIEPVSDNFAVRMCNLCSCSVAHAEAFLYPTQNVIVQIDMCPNCASYYLEVGHTPYFMVALRRELEIFDGD